MQKSSLCNYSGAYIIVKGTITITGAEADAAARNADERNKQVTFKNCALCTYCISEVNNTQVDNVKDLDNVMLMYDPVECSNNYAKTSASFWWYHKDDHNDNITDSELFKFKARITGRTPCC